MLTLLQSRLSRIPIPGETRVYGVRIAGFESEKDAKSVVDALKGQGEPAKYPYKVGR